MRRPWESQSLPSPLAPAEGEEEAAATATGARRGPGARGDDKEEVGDKTDGGDDDAMESWKARCGAVALFAMARGKAAIARGRTARVEEESIIAEKACAWEKIRISQARRGARSRRVRRVFFFFFFLTFSSSVFSFLRGRRNLLYPLDPSLRLRVLSRPSLCSPPLSEPPISTAEEETTEERGDRGKNTFDDQSIAAVFFPPFAFAFALVLSRDGPPLRRREAQGAQEAG